MIKLMFTFWRLNLKGAFEYKTSFLVQVIGMFISDIFTLTIFYFFFLKFGKMGNMGMDEYLILYACLLFIFCTVHILFGGYVYIAKYISEGGLDSFILLPKNILMLILLSKPALSVFGDFFFGIAVLFLIKGITFFFVIQMLFYSFFGGLILLGFLIFFHSLAFFVGGSKEMAKLPFDLMLGPAHYPPSSFEGTFLKIIYMSIIPVVYAFFYPYQLLIKFDLGTFLILMLASFLYFGFSIFFFYKGLKKYESGNVISFVQ